MHLIIITNISDSKNTVEKSNIIYSRYNFNFTAESFNQLFIGLTSGSVLKLLFYGAIIILRCSQMNKLLYYNKLFLVSVVRSSGIFYPQKSENKNVVEENNGKTSLYVI